MIPITTGVVFKVLFPANLPNGLDGKVLKRKLQTVCSAALYSLVDEVCSVGVNKYYAGLVSGAGLEFICFVGGPSLSGPGAFEEHYYRLNDIIKYKIEQECLYSEAWRLYVPWMMSNYKIEPTTNMLI